MRAKTLDESQSYGQGNYKSDPYLISLYIVSNRFSSRRTGDKTKKIIIPFTPKSARFKMKKSGNCQKQQQLFNSFHLNGHTLGFDKQNKKRTTKFIDSRFDSGS